MTRDRQLSFGGIPVRYRVYRPVGEIQNRVLMLPSPLLSAEQFEHLAMLLESSGCLCVVCDLPGFGKTASSAQKMEDSQMTAKMLWGVLDAADKEEGGRLSCWHIISHGLAIQTAWDMSQHSPDSVASFVHICPAPTAPGFLRHKWVFSLMCRLSVSSAVFSMMARVVYGRKVSQKEISPLRRAFMRPGVQENLARMLAREAPKAPFFSFAPKLVLWSGQDSMLGQKISPDVLTALPDAEYHTLRTAGHVPMCTHTRAVLDYLRGWLAENGSYPQNT